jgi:GDP-4-dehydro-6-deoxy-D-mannose reductase
MANNSNHHSNYNKKTTQRSCGLVTGALGFVGRHLARSLILGGQPVIGVGKHPAGAELPAQVGPFVLQGPATDLPGAVNYVCDAGTMWYLPMALEDAAPIADLMAKLRPSTVYHLAAQSSAAVSFKEPVETFNSNVLGTLNLLEALRGTKPGERPVLLAVGSCEEYGPQPAANFPLAEDAALGPISPYGVSKVCQTLLCRQYAKSYDMPVILTRSFSHTGPGHDARFAFPSFARQIAAAEAGKGPTEIKTGDLSAVRDFLDVRDVIAAYRILTKEGRPGEIYNVSSGKSMTIQEGLEILISGATCPITLKKDPARCRPSDLPIMVGDNTKLKTETGWDPEWDFTATLLGLLDEARKEYQ